ncbi:MAG: hypothetical protein N3A71_01210 [Candidatus Dojkabacteria bacterium]|nr:hypothetical protein [Candidatus Dojkabacteria bacterium]
MDSGRLVDISKNSNNIIFILPEFVTIDVVSATLLLARFYKNNGKEVTLGHSGKLGKYAEYLIEYAGFKVSDIKKSIDPISYVVKIKDLNDQVYVGYKQVDDILEIYVTPENKAVDFSKIVYTKTGGIYDTNIYLGCSDISVLGSIYTDFAAKYEKFNNIPINKNNSDITLAEFVWELIVSEGAHFSEIDAKLVAYGIIFGTRFLQNIRSNSTYKFIESLQSIYKINLTEIISNIYGDDLVYKLRKKVYSKAVLDNVRKAVYVLVNTDELENMDIDLLFSFFVLSDGINTILVEIDEKSLYFITNRSDLINFKSQIIIDGINYIYREKSHEALTDVMNFISYGFSIAQNQVVEDTKSVVEENKVFQQYSSITPSTSQTQNITDTKTNFNYHSVDQTAPQHISENTANIYDHSSFTTQSNSFNNPSYSSNNTSGYGASNISNNNQANDQSPPFVPSNEVVIDPNAKPYYVPNSSTASPFQKAN